MANITWLPIFDEQLVEDYPYGFRLRTTLKIHIEYKKGKGFRVGRTTINPKNWRWNATKYSTYDSFKRLYRDNETGYIESCGFDSNTTLEKYEKALAGGIFNDVPAEVYDHKRDMAMTLFTSIRFMTSFQWWTVNWTFDEETRRNPPELTEEDKENMQKIDFDKILPIYKRISEEYEANEELRKANKAEVFNHSL